MNKRQIVALLLFVCFPMLINTMGKDENKVMEEKISLTFVAAHPGENLKKYKAILQSVYPKMATPEKQDAVLGRVEEVFFSRESARATPPDLRRDRIYTFK